MLALMSLGVALLGTPGNVPDGNPDGLTFGQARTRALKTYPAVEGARLAALATRQRVTPALLWDDPRLTAQVFQLPLDNFQNGLMPGLNGQERATAVARGPALLPLMISASQTFPFPGKKAAASAEVYATAQQRDAMTEAVQADVARAVAYAYAEAYAAGASVELVRLNAQVMDTAVQTVDARLATGGGSQAAALAARSARTVLDRDILAYEQQRNVARARLSALLGYARVTALPALVERPTLVALPPHDRLLQAALEQRPELKGAKAAVAAATARARQAQLAVFPDVTASASYMFSVGGPGVFRDNGPYRALLGPPDMVGVGISVPIPVFAPWKQVPLVDAARLERKRANKEVETIIRNIESDVNEILANIEATRGVADLDAKRLIPLAEQGLDAAQSAYVAGQVDIVLFLEAIREVRMRHLEYLSALTRYARALADLERVTGMKVLVFEPAVASRPVVVDPASQPASPATGRGE